MSAKEQGFGLHQAKQAVLDAINSEGVSDANKASLDNTLALLRGLEAVVVSEASPALRVYQLLKLLGMRSSKRGVHFQRDELLVELVALMTLERGLDKPDVTLFQNAGYHAGMSHERSVEKVWVELGGAEILDSYRSRAKDETSARDDDFGDDDVVHWTSQQDVISKQIKLIANLLARR